MLDIKSVRRSFSRASGSYDSNAHLQKRIGLELIEYMKVNCARPEKILDIGAGTGWLGQQLADFFEAEVLCIDSARGMVCAASARKDLKVLEAEAQNLPFKDESFDCLVSNLALQWIADLDLALKESARVLEPEGIIYFSCFTQGTLEELRLSLSSNPQLKSYPTLRLPDEEVIRLSLKNNGFKEIDIINKKISELFYDLFDLLKWLKSIGANTPDKPRFISRENLRRLNDFYLSNFRSNGKVYATFNIIKVSAEK